MADDGLKYIKAYACDCGRGLSAEEILDSVSGYVPTQKLFASCPGCKANIELEVVSGALTIGYSYFGGAMHFEPMLRLHATGLVTSLDDDEVLTVSFKNRQWTFQPPADLMERFAIFNGSTFDGKTLGELKLDEISVRVESVERGHQKLANTPSTLILKGGDILNLRGTHKNLNIAFTRIFKTN
jgi:hypothetical protein